MVNTTHYTPKTVLKDRTIWFDGDSVFDPNKLLLALRKYDVRYVTEITPQISEYNRNVSRAEEIHTKEHCNELSTNWTIPQQYQRLDVVDYISRAHSILMEGLDEDDIDQRERRLVEELRQYKKLGLFDVLRAIIWIINTLTANDIIWGVGRGSSVSSYVLYIIGVHDVDSYEYDLDIGDFLHE
jgi:DNA polymerase III alpha subunit